MEWNRRPRQQPADVVTPAGILGRPRGVIDGDVGRLPAASTVALHAAVAGDATAEISSRLTAPPPANGRAEGVADHRRSGVRLAATGLF
jgi:hypothetical protein